MKAFRTDVLRVYLANGINGLLGVLVVAVGVRVLGKENYALFSIYAVVFSFVTLMESGVTKNLVRLLALAPDPESQARQINRVFGCYLLIGLLLLLVLPLAATVVPRDIFALPLSLRRPAGWIIAIAVAEYLVSLPSATVFWYGIATQRFQRNTRFTVVSGLYRYGLLLVGLLWLRTPLAAVGFAAGRRLLDLWVAPLIIGRLPPGSWRIRLDRAGLAELLRDSVPMTLAQCGVVTITAIPSVLTSRWFGVETLGVFRAVFDLCGRVWFFSVGLGQVLFPKLVRLLSGEESQRESRRIREAMAWSWLAYTGLAFLGVMVTPWALRLLDLGGPDRGWLFITTLLGTCISAHTQFAFELLQAGRRYRPLVVAVGLTVVVMPTTILLLSSRGLVAVGMGWLLGQFFHAATMDAASLAYLNTPWRSQGVLLLAKVGAVAGVIGLGLGVAAASVPWAAVSLILLGLTAFHARRAHAA